MACVSGWRDCSPLQAVGKYEDTDFNSILKDWSLFTYNLFEVLPIVGPKFRVSGFKVLSIGVSELEWNLGFSVLVFCHFLNF